MKPSSGHGLKENVFLGYWKDGDRYCLVTPGTDFAVSLDENVARLILHWPQIHESLMFVNL